MSRLTATVARLRLFFDRSREPLRRRVYTAVATGVAGAVSFGLLTGDTATSVVALAGVALVIPATETARSRVSPTDTATGRHALPDTPERDS